MSLRKMPQPGLAVAVDSLVKASRLGGRVSASWLAGDSTFQEALQGRIKRYVCSQSIGSFCMSAYRIKIQDEVRVPPCSP